MHARYLLFHHADSSARVSEVVASLPQAVSEQLSRFSLPRQATLSDWQNLFEQQTGLLSEDTRVLALLDDDSFRTLWQTLHAHETTLIPLPWSDNPLTRKGFHLPDVSAPDYARQQLEALHADQSLPARRHALIVQDNLRVLHTLSIGPLDRTSDTFRQGLQHWRTHPEDFRLHAYTLTTAKRRTLHCSCLHIVAGEESVLPLPDDTPPPYRTGKLCARLKAPRSFIHLLWRYFLHRREGTENGWIKTTALTIENSAGQPIIFHWNEHRMQAERLRLRIEPTTCRVITGQPLKPDTQDKEVVRLQSIPQTPELIDSLAERPLPLFPVAEESAFATLFSQQRQQARFTTEFAMLLILSVLIATLGLFQNASPVIIGAMVLAPLMAPIISLSMGAIRLEKRLLITSLMTLLKGMGLAIGLATLTTWLMPHPGITEQILSRTHPNLLDLWIAIFSGIAAAYVHARRDLYQNLAGVAIAVALVPPLAVTGIGLGQGNLTLFGGALLLFLANLIGILFAAGLTFYMLGFSSFKTLKVTLPWKIALLAGMILLLVGVSSTS